MPRSAWIGPACASIALAMLSPLVRHAAGTRANAVAVSLQLKGKRDSEPARVIDLPKSSS